MGQGDGLETGGAVRILVIDASITVSLMICGLLRRWGYRAETRFAEPGCDLVIADPATADPRLTALRRQGVPWLALLSAGDARDAADAAFWVHKPIDAAELQDAVIRCLQESCVAPAAESIDVAVIAELWESPDNPAFRRVAAAFVRELQQALGMIAQSLHAQDRRRLAREAHSVVGAAANVGAVHISRAARAVEEAAPHAGVERLHALAEQLAAISRRDLPALQGLIEA
jgi:HPt (histidine-containing phosphotransfer) domain-containing protein